MLRVQDQAKQAAHSDPDLSRARGRLIGGDLDVNEEGSVRTIKTLQSLHHDSIGYQQTRTRIGLAKKAKLLQMQSRTQARTRKMQLNL
jgi:hypothetical protein